ncbi:uncharacterized protein LOC115622145 isoform X2 [Scaptodrosophila lebanonensis]|uniref:Uncharacterized protein LOC115622145 isoform X2 n=1 Tax=Drosophila lebanonensis TaxID=7225 RepID=A0A6J2TA88_DROLE|nr:uncharacterized protein LOC115622145 isoform X2 [Scaptodrosophila lebanonensis]
MKNCANTETGELEYFYAEPQDTARIKQLQYDEETGEPVHGQVKVRYRKHGHFHVPKHYLQGTLCDQVDNVLTNRYQRDLDITVTHGSNLKRAENSKPKAKPGYEREDYIQMDCVSSNIILGYERNHCLLFLIPTLFCHNLFLAILMALLEIGLHMLSHYKNGLTMHKNLHFRSPMHVLTSQFCAICRTETDSQFNRIFDILNEQMRKSHRSGTLKNISKAIG